MTSFTRGPLPARVYWTRRLLLVALALLLVFGIGRLLSLGSDGSSAPATAAEVAAEATSTPSAGTTPTPTAGSPTAGAPTAGATINAPLPGKRHASQAPVLAEPQGSCADEDVAVTPEVKKAVAGPQGEVRIALHLSTLKSEACTWHVSHTALALKITSGSDDIWSSRQCPGVVPVADVVVRRAVTTTVDVGWNGRRADRGCGKLSDWALPGTYHVTAAALAGEPADEQFELKAPQPRVITVAPSPTQDPSSSKGTTKGATKAGSPAPSATSAGH